MEIPDNRPTENLVPEPTAQPAIEEMEKTKKLEGAGTRQPCGRVVGIIRRNWREKQYCGSLRVEGDRAVASGKGQSTSAVFMPVDRKVNHFGVHCVFQCLASSKLLRTCVYPVPQSLSRFVFSPGFSSSRSLTMHMLNSCIADPVGAHPNPPTRRSEYQKNPGGDGLMAGMVQVPSWPLRQDPGREGCQGHRD